MGGIKSQWTKLSKLPNCALLVKQGKWEKHINKGNLRFLQRFGLSTFKYQAIQRISPCWLWTLISNIIIFNEIIKLDTAVIK